MKTIKLVLVMIMAVSLAAAQSQGFSGDLMGSMADSLSSRVQERILNKTLLSIPSDDPKVNAIELNKKLRELNLPTIDVESKSLRIKPTMMNGFAGSDLVGAEITDGKHRYCLPCETGWNSFESGIMKVKTPEELFKSNREKVSEFFGTCEYDPSNTSILEINGQNCGSAAQFICQSEAKCVKVVDGKKENLIVTSSCLAPNEQCPSDPLDCFASRNIVTRVSGSSAIGDDSFPRRAEEPAKMPRKAVQ